MTSSTAVTSSFSPELARSATVSWFPSRETSRCARTRVAAFPASPRRTKRQVLRSGTRAWGTSMGSRMGQQLHGATAWGNSMGPVRMGPASWGSTQQHGPGRRVRKVPAAWGNSMVSVSRHVRIIAPPTILGLRGPVGWLCTCVAELHASISLVCGLPQGSDACPRGGGSCAPSPSHTPLPPSLPSLTRPFWRLCAWWTRWWLAAMSTRRLTGSPCTGSTFIHTLCASGGFRMCEGGGGRGIIRVGSGQGEKGGTGGAIN